MPDSFQKNAELGGRFLTLNHREESLNHRKKLWSFEDFPDSIIIVNDS